MGTGRVTVTRRLRSSLICTDGFSLAELLVVLGVIGILAVISLPILVDVLQAQQTKGAAQELVTLLNQARQLAIATNSRYRVEIDTVNNRLRFAQSTDGGATYNPQIGAGTDGAGYRGLENQARISAVNITPPNFTFNHLGTGNQGTITVQDSRSNSSLGVVVATTGRIRICPPNCP